MTETQADEYNIGTPVGQVRLLINDVPSSDAGFVFSNDELQAFLTLEGGSVKLAAAQALDVIADDEALTAKVIRDSDGKSTDGARVADSLRKRATSLRSQAASETADVDEGYFEVVDLDPGFGRPPELTAWPY